MRAQCTWESIPQVLHGSKRYLPGSERYLPGSKGSPGAAKGSLGQQKGPLSKRLDVRGVPEGVYPGGCTPRGGPQYLGSPLILNVYGTWGP